MFSHDSALWNITVIVHAWMRPNFHLYGCADFKFRRDSAWPHWCKIPSVCILFSIVILVKPPPTHTFFFLLGLGGTSQQQMDSLEGWLLPSYTDCSTSVHVNIQWSCLNKAQPKGGVSVTRGQKTVPVTAKVQIGTFCTILKMYPFN